MIGSILRVSRMEQTTLHHIDEGTYVYRKADGNVKCTPEAP